MDRFIEPNWREHSLKARPANAINHGGALSVRQDKGSYVCDHQKELTLINRSEYYAM